MSGISTQLTLSRRGVLGLLLLLFAAPVLAADDAPPTVKVVIDYGDGVQKHFTALPWREGMTVRDALHAAQKHPRGVKFQERGSGATAFLTQLDDLKNEGGGRNWIYRVNDQLADRSFAVFPLQVGDAVLWKFEKSR